ncbi:hypothetical protein FH972_005808 [Carpinus fangiana]|uniref:Pentacotripeptide-repeat region of PRORP domain-containing protein n=1 Tax=Carpinus fangiana TaxID=176857 RepID=A0A5N6QSA8_9ROSI|nr:hypothetical protein FH972_005808 [Carpinus fangiana]
MTLSLRKPIKASNLVNQYQHFQLHSTAIPNFNGHFTTTQLRALDQGRGQGRQRGEQVRLPNGSSMPLSRMLHSYSHYSLYRSYCQVPLLLPHPTSLSDLQGKLLISSSRNVNPEIGSLPIVNLRGKMLDLRHRGFCRVTKENLLSTNCRVINVRLPVLPIVNLPVKVFDFSYRGFASVTGSGIDSDAENESGDDDNGDGDCTEGVGAKSGVDPNEVNRVCKVIDELFALDRNMETVLDECGIDLSHDLVVDVLQRFKHARKPAFRFFCWVGQKPGFAHDSRTYNVMMNVLGKTRQFETMVSMLEEMGEKGLLTIETFMIAIKAFAAAKERKKAVGTFELMKKYKFKVGADTINCLLDTLGRAKLGKEAQTLFEKLKGFGNQKNMDMVFGLLKEMKEKSCPPDGRTYNALIKLMTNRRMPDDAVRIYKKMIESGIEPSIHTYNMIMKSYFQTRNYEMGHAVWDEMIQKGCCPDDNSYTVFIRGLISQGRSGDACIYLEEMIEKGMKAPQLDYNRFAADFSRAGKPGILEDLAQKMKFAGKFEESNVFARWADMMKKRVKRRDPIKASEQYT